MFFKLNLTFFLSLFILFSSLFIPYHLYSLAPFRNLFELEQGFLTEFKTMRLEGEMKELKKHPISPQVIDALTTSFFVPTDIFSFFNSTFVGREIVPQNNRDAQRVNCAWLYTMIATRSFDFNALYNGSTFLSSCYNRFVIPETPDIHSFFRPLRNLIEWGCDLTQSSFLGSPLDIASGRIERGHQMSLRHFILDESDLNHRTIAIRSSTPGQAETIHQEALRHIDTLQYGFKSPLEVLIQTTAPHNNPNHYQLLLFIISLSDLTERSSHLGNTPLIAFLERIRKHPFSHPHTLSLVNSFLFHQSPLFQQNNEGDTALSIVFNKTWTNLDLQKQITILFKKTLKNNPPLPYQYLLQNFWGVFSLPEPASSNKPELTRFLFQYPSFKPDYGSTNKFLNFMDTLDDMMDFFLHVARICPVIETSKNQLRQQHVVNKLTSILLTKKHWVSSYSTDSFLTLYKQNKIPYDALVWLSIAVLQQENITLEQLSFFTQILQKVQSLETEQLLSPQAQLHLSLLTDLNQGQLDANKMIQAIYEGHNVFIMMLAINEKKAFEILQQWIQKGLPLPFYNPRNVTERMTFLALQQKCSALYGKTMNPLYTHTLTELQNENEQLEKNIVPLQSLDDLSTLMNISPQDSQQNKYTVEGRSLYFEIDQGQVVIKFQTNSDDENGFLDGALINLGHKRQFEPISTVYSKALLVTLPESLFHTVESQIKQQEKFKNARIDNKAIVFLHPNYQDRILKKRPAFDEENKEPSETLNTFSKQLQKNMEDFLDLANHGVFLDKVSSYSHGLGLDGERRNVDEAVYLDLIDTRNHGKGIIAELTDGVKDSNLGTQGFVDPGNLLTLGVKTDYYTRDNKILFEMTSSQERDRLYFVQYSKTLMGYLQNAYMAWLVFLSEQPEITYNMIPSQFIDMTFQMIVEPFLNKITPTLQAPLFHHYILSILSPLLEEDFKYFKRFKQEFSFPIIRENIRDFSLQNFFTGCAFLVSLASLNTLQTDIQLPDSLIQPSASLLTPFMKRLKKRQELIDLILKKDLNHLQQDKENFIQEAFFIKEYFLLNHNNEALFFMIENISTLFKDSPQQDIHEELYRTVFIWQKELLLDAIIFNNIRVIEFIHLNNPSIFYTLVAEIISTTLQSQNEDVLCFLLQKVPDLLLKSPNNNAFLDFNDFKRIFPRLDIQFCQVFFKKLICFKSMNSSRLLKIITASLTPQQFADFLSDDTIHSSFIQHSIPFPKRIQKNIHLFPHLFPFDILDTCFLNKNFISHLLLEVKKELLPLIQLIANKQRDNFASSFQSLYFDLYKMIFKKNCSLLFDAQREIFKALLIWTTFEEFKTYLPLFIKTLQINNLTIEIEKNFPFSDAIYEKLTYVLENTPCITFKELRENFETAHLSLYNYSDSLTLHLTDPSHIDYHRLKTLLLYWTPPIHLIDQIVERFILAKGFTLTSFYADILKYFFSAGDTFREFTMPSPQQLNQLDVYAQKIKEKNLLSRIVSLIGPCISHYFLYFNPSQINASLHLFPESLLWTFYLTIERPESRLALVQYTLTHRGELSLEQMDRIIEKNDIQILYWALKQTQDPQASLILKDKLKIASFQFIHQPLKNLCDSSFDCLTVCHQFLDHIFSSSEYIDLFMQSIDKKEQFETILSELNTVFIFLDCQKRPSIEKQWYTISLFDFLTFVFLDTKLSPQTQLVNQPYVPSSQQTSILISS